jgi:hypothetical protein
VVQVECNAPPQYGYTWLWTPTNNSVINTEMKMPLDKIVMNAQYLWKTQLNFPVPFCHNAFYVTAFSAKIMSLVKFYRG